MNNIKGKYLILSLGVIVFIVLTFAAPLASATDDGFGCSGQKQAKTSDSFKGYTDSDLSEGRDDNADVCRDPKNALGKKKHPFLLERGGYYLKKLMISLFRP